MILTGGPDIDPRLYGEEILNDSVTLAPVRDRGEKILCALAEARGFPVMGICRGMQYLNFYYGGDLYQDIPTQLETEVKHRMEPPYRRTSHRCLLAENSPLRQLLGTDEISVNSHHHQAVRKAAPGFEIMARCDDGVIEAIRRPEHKFFWGIQWHPEKIFDIDANSAKIFAAFVEACR
jgi:putative glutamine amidotransferase